MGGKSSNNSKQQSATTNTNIGIHGDAEGHVVNGDATITEYGENFTGGNRTEIDGDFTGGNRTETEIGDDFTGGNRTEYGDDFTNGNRFDTDDFTGGDRIEIGEEFTGGDRINTEIDGDYYNGNYTVTDGGAFDMAEAVFGDLIASQNEALSNSLAAAEAANSNMKDTAFEAMNQMQQTNQDALAFGNSAINHVQDTASDALDFGSNALSEYSNQAMLYAEELQTVMDTAIESATDSANRAIDSNNKTTEIGFDKIEDIAAKTALGGQTVVAEQAGQMVKYISFAFAALFLGVIGLKVIK